MQNFLKDLRLGKNLKQEEVAEKCHISSSYYSLIETGARIPSIYIAKSIASLLNFDWTLFYEDNIKCS